jgi:hypothetical protein
MAVVVEGYITFVAPGSKTPWQAMYRPKAGETLQANQSNTLPTLFQSVKDAEVAIEARVGKKLAWTPPSPGATVLTYIGRSS